MIGAINGIVHTPITNPLLIMVGGMGYRVAVSDHLLSEIHTDKPIFLYTHTHVREDTLDLYGFITPEELSLFTLLLSVSGIGPKTSLTIIGRGALAVKHAIMTADVPFFTSIPRLGRKNAQKIIIELKSKLGSLEDLDLSGEVGETKEILEALESMGFAKKEAYAALKQLKVGDLPVEERLRQALKLLSKK